MKKTILLTLLSLFLMGCENDADLAKSTGNGKGSSGVTTDNGVPDVTVNVNVDGNTTTVNNNNTNNNSSNSSSENNNFVEIMNKLKLCSDNKLNDDICSLASKDLSTIIVPQCTQDGEDYLCNFPCDSENYYDDTRGVWVCEENPLKGEDGTSCTVTQETNGAKIVCEDGTESFIFNGLDGMKGEKGEKGNRGARGKKGEQGTQGVQGEKGDKGDKGVQGEKGEKGERGEKGDKGEKGDVPYCLKNQNDDRYSCNFQCDENAIYNDEDKKWTCDENVIAGLKGDKGDKGDQGEQGEQGLQGESGQDGDQGEKGVKGDQGLMGLQGEEGQDGVDGKSCSVIQEANGAKIVCEDGTSAVVSNGLNGQDGEDGVDGEDGKDGTTTECKSCCKDCYAEKANHHAIWFPDHTGLGKFVFVTKGDVQYYKNKMVVKGLVKSTTDHEKLFYLEATFRNKIESYDNGGTIPPMSPKDAPQGVNTNSWEYYTDLEATLIGHGDYTGAVLQLTRKGPAIQTGEGAGIHSTSNGAATWFEYKVLSQSNRHNVPIYNKSHYGKNYGDINIKINCAE